MGNRKTFPVCVACSAQFTTDEELAEHTVKEHKGRKSNLTAEGKPDSAEMDALKKENMQLKAELDAMSAENTVLKEQQNTAPASSRRRGGKAPADAGRTEGNNDE